MRAHTKGKSVPMRERLRSQLTYANVMASIAVFLVLGGGSAVALSGSNTVFSNDIAPGEVKTPDLATGAATNPKLASGAVNSPKVVDNSLTGNDVHEATLGEVPSALLGGRGRSGSDPECNPESDTFETCVATPFVTLEPARVLVIAAVSSRNTGSDITGLGACHLGSSSFGKIAGTQQKLQVNGRESFSLVGVTDPLPAGTYAFGVDCTEYDGITYVDAQISAVALSPN